ncbi:MAG: DegT/DnrJ/EryC1/StrS family aminotransferase [Candidatus Synoicihabitans palmerolidicus]|nr:DegT/DnrJ/EryC1/StrS family aminotransferase [Candidatus Synoicihabitans palmerolidicus]
MQAAVLRVLLPELDAFNARRREIALSYQDQLDGCGLALPWESAAATSVWPQFPIRTPHRDRLRSALAARQIGSALLYPTPIHRQPAYRQTALSLPLTESACREVLGLPIYPGLTDDEIGRVCGAIREMAPDLEV